MPEVRLRLAAAFLAWLDKARCDAAARGCFLSALVVALERLAFGFALGDFCPFLESRAAFFRVASEAVPFFGGASFTPARRAFDNPMAMACLLFFAPCLPARI